MTNNPWTERRKRKRIGEAGRRSEAALAEQMGGILTPASGATRGKGDFHLPEFLAECKSTASDSLVLKWRWLSKIREQALAAGKAPVLFVTFTDEHGKAVKAGDYAVIPRYLFQELTER